MPTKQARDKKPMQRLLPEERGEHGEPAGYVYDLETLANACQRMSLNISKITQRLNRAESWMLGNKQRIIEQEECWREGKLRLEAERHRELLKGYAAYRMALERAAANRANRASGRNAEESQHVEPFGRYGPDQNYRKLAPLIDGLKKTAFNAETVRRSQALTLLQHRKAMAEIDRRLSTSAVLDFHRRAKFADKLLAGCRNKGPTRCGLPPIAEVEASTGRYSHTLAMAGSDQGPELTANALSSPT